MNAVNEIFPSWQLFYEVAEELTRPLVENGQEVE
jgi:hypothetical protein